jgi:hypothetical protein
LNVARSGAVACGKVASRQPSQADASFVSIDDETFSWFCFSALSRVHDDTQATNSHRKLIGRNAATSLLSGKRDINTVRIIHIQRAIGHLALLDRVFVAKKRTGASAKGGLAPVQVPVNVLTPSTGRTERFTSCSGFIF